MAVRHKGQAGLASTLLNSLLSSWARRAKPNPVAGTVLDEIEVETLENSWRGRHCGLVDWNALSLACVGGAIPSNMR